MTEMIRTWLLGVTSAAMILALAELLVPQGSMRRLCRFGGGLILLLAVINPVMSLKNGELDRLMVQYQKEAERCQNELTEQNQILYESIIAKETAAYILDKAVQMGIDCQVTVAAAWNKDGLPIPHTVTLRGDWSQGQREKLAAVIEEEIGIPAAMQYYKEKGA